MSRIRKALIVFLAAVLILTVAAVVVIHLPAVQRGFWDRVTTAVHQETGWRVGADSIRMRLWPARFEAKKITIGTEGPPVVQIESLAVRFRWRRIVSVPRRLDRVDVRGPRVDLRNFEMPRPSQPPAQPSTVDPWSAVEVGELKLTDGSVVGADGLPIGVRLNGLRAGGILEGGTAGLEATVDSLALDREGRGLDLGPLTVRVHGEAGSVRLDSLEMAGDAINARGKGEASTMSPYATNAEFGCSVDLAQVVTWWDPQLAEIAAPRGRLEIQGQAAFDAARGFEVELEHSGSVVTVGEIALDQAGLTYRDQHTQAWVSLADQGRLEVDLDDKGRAALMADLDGIPMGSTLALVDHPLVAALPSGLELSGRMTAQAQIPFSARSFEADGWCRVRWPEGQVEVSGRGNPDQWTVDTLRVQIPGAAATAQGSGRGENISATMEIDAHDPVSLIDWLTPWLPELSDFGIGGGPASMTAEVGGSASEPTLTGSGLWNDPSMSGYALSEIEAEFSAGAESMRWNLTAAPVSGANLSAEGTTLWEDFQTTGQWHLQVSELGALAHYLEIEPAEVWGTVEGGGGFAWGPENWLIEGNLNAGVAGGAGWRLDSANVQFHGSPESITLDELRMSTAGGFVRASGSLAPAILDGVLQAEFSLENLDLSELGSPVAGVLSGHFNFSGSPANPEGFGMMAWVPPGDDSLTGPLTVTVRLSEGVAEFGIDGWETAAGPISGQASLPAGDFPRPDWLWPTATGGPLRGHFSGLGLRSAPVLEALGREPLPAEVSGDLAVDLHWDPGDLTQRFLLAEVENLRAIGSYLELTTAKPLRLKIDSQRVELEPLTLEGPRNRLHIGGVYEMDSTRLVGGLEMDVDPTFFEMLPLPVHATGAMKVRMGVDGPIGAATAALEVDHTGGTIVLRDPAVRLTDLRLNAEVADGILWIQDGEAGLNRGRVLMGGGWDPESGQGVVFELDQVTTLLTSGIVTNWSGTIAVEPSREHAALVVGELDLNAGLWERTFNLTEAFMGTSVTETESNEILADIALDLQVRGYGGVRVNNNLGNFDATWGLLEVGGTADRPVLTGGLRLAPGGTVNLPGQTVTIRSAQVDFTGNPDTDPSIEIIPESLNSGSLIGDGGSGVDTQTLAAEGLARGLGSVLGMENTTLRPAEIAFETQTDAASAFTAGTRLSRTVALFFTTDLSDVQNQTTMLQLWNLRGLPGLALQGYSRTVDDDAGFNAIERYRWGGTKPSDDEPIIQRIKMEGDWPLSTRRLKKATGLRRGEPYDPFLLFAAGLNLEAELASAGYPRARVTAESVGDERLPVLVFSSELGPRQDFRFQGDIPPEHVQRAAVGQFLPDPLETRSLREMSRTIRRHFLGEGFPQATVTVERQDDLIVIDSDRGQAVALVGPVVEGVPEDIERTIQTFLGAPVELAQISQDPDRAKRVVERLMALEGYPEARLDDLWVTVNDPSHIVHLRIEPGEPNRLGRVVVTGEDPLDLATGGIPGLEQGMPLARRELDRAFGRLRSQYRAAGYSEVTVESAISESDDGEWVLTVDVQPRRQRTLREVQVGGLRHIRESVIVNGLDVQPGDTVTPENVDQSAIDTAFFSPVDQARFRSTQVGPDQVDLEIDVIEKPRWTVEAGAGWSSERGARLQFGFRDDGLLGRGAGISFRGQWEEIQQQATLYLSLPPLPGGRWSSVANLLWYDGDSRDYPDERTEERIGAGVETTYSIGRFTSVRGYLQFTETEQDVKDPRFDPLDLFPITTREAIVGTQFRLDHLDNPFDPRSGWLAAVDFSHNTPELGSDFDDLRLVLTGSAAIAPRDGWTWSQALRSGAAEALGDSRLASVRKFYAGGQASVRGFDLDSIGPFRIDGNGNPAPTGGGALFVLNEELRVPVWGPLRLAVFADVGQVWETWSDASFKFSIGAGLGLRFSTPVGPLWADVAWPVSNLNISSPGPKYYVGIGTPF